MEVASAEDWMGVVSTAAKVAAVGETATGGAIL